jgi:hypothetical protein
MSEMELSTFRQRSREAVRAKAARGELFQRVAIGYELDPLRRLQKSADRRVQASIELVFRRFRELGSVRQVLLWLRQERIELPCTRHGGAGRGVVWRSPGYQTLHHMLTNPVYAGAYSYGRTTSRAKLDNGRKRVLQGVRVAREDWPVLLRARHEGYINWDEYEANQRIIADNANMKGAMTRGAVRRGFALLAGLLRRGHCGRKLHVAYAGHQTSARYHCRDANVNHGVPSCATSFGSVRADRAVSEEVLRVLQPFGIAASCARAAGTGLLRKAAALYPGPRAGTLRGRPCPPPIRRGGSRQSTGGGGTRARRWNASLVVVAQREAELAAAAAEQAQTTAGADRDQLLALGRDVSALWHDPGASVEIKKRLLRTVLREAVVKITDGKLRFLLHWQGGDHTVLETREQRSGEHRWQTDIETARIVTELARVVPDGTIAAFLNRAGRRTAKGHTWTKARVCAFRNQRQVPCYREGERRERGELVLDEATQELAISKMTAIRLIQDKLLPARQACPGAPWIIAFADLDLPAVREAALNGRRPVPNDPRQEALVLQ